jgi:two-component system response regulator PilR (NtrC family)
LRKYAAALGRHVVGIEPDALSALCDYDYPGNVRELENLMERAVTLESGERITRASLPELKARRPVEAPVANGLPPEGIDLDRAIADLERDLITAALKRTDGVRKEAAKLLGISFRSLRYRLAKMGVAVDDEKDEPSDR